MFAKPVTSRITLHTIIIYMNHDEETAYQARPCLGESASAVAMVLLIELLID